MEVFVARQPIFNRNREVIAYELLYRDGNKNFFDASINSSKATSILLVNSYFSIGLENLTKTNKAFINFDKNLIHNDIPLIFNKDTIVIELLEDIIPDENFINKIKNLKSHGYIIALDDYKADYPYENLVELSDILKVDVLNNTIYDLEKIVKKYDNNKRKFLAEKVETNEMFDFVKSIGYDYFQGYFFNKPTIIKGRGICGNRIHYFLISEELNKKEPSYDKITKIIESDTSIAYTFLRLVNSKFTLISEIHSIKHALAMLGLKEIEKWVYIVMMQNFQKNSCNETFKTSLFRSKLGEFLAENSIHNNRKNEVMLMGLMSVIDTLLEEPMEKILKKLPLSEDIKKALLQKDSPLTDIYNFILKYEEGRWEEISIYAQKLNIDIHKLPDFYFESIKWTDELNALITENKSV
ncbi:EAL and HDOD domain-containing protein [Tepidibacter mesophilus]|uniref:EAL and HDOD domain-containing protein n=1 Tax=Tepidibacter mesophilus TaxID=655607 RepID=UPI0016516157|nr:HDOD domain-containing protein [Tepidibacter mesophilus]